VKLSKALASVNFCPEMCSQTCSLGLEKTDPHHSSAHHYTPVASFTWKAP